jgi:cytochrome c biogenesis protein CcmG/thiol:disulfide interchange protein DsbE
VLVAFSEKTQVPIVGLSYKEIQPQDAAYKAPFDDKLKLARERSQVWLKRHGNPYVTTVMDLDGRVGINYGVYGVPETYVIDKGGVIRYKFVGAVTPALLAEKILPLISELNKS